MNRREKNNPRILAGAVEEVGLEGNKAFTNVDELLDILSPKKRRESHNLRKQVNKRMMEESPISDRF
jgi:hypothetical protein